MERHQTLIASVQRALHLVDEIGEAERPLTAKSLARRTGLALPTTYHLLRTLVHEGYVLKVDGGYVLGDRVAVLSERGRGLTRSARFRPVLRGLHDDLRAAAYLSVLDDGEIELVDVVDSPAAPRADLWVGFHQAAHATALGKAVLSTLDEEARSEYLAAHDLPDLTCHTVTDRRRLLRQLEDPAPYALDREEYAVGTACVAVPVPSLRITGAVAVSVPARQVARVVERADVLRRAARLVAYAAEEDR
ncbi:MAG TPA: IclR family transcriptional regulator C-terminal domain-containing protein [Jiangellales bacterium]|nr:IclR family transcriptional regulator C-terminal domain-containing protein [Jiangellales bacterium]